MVIEAWLVPLAGLERWGYCGCLLSSDSPRRLWWYHWICWLLSVVGIFCILLAHDHYTVDVVVAYYVTTRLFWWYHTMANQQVSVLLAGSPLPSPHPHPPLPGLVVPAGRGEGAERPRTAWGSLRGVGD